MEYSIIYLKVICETLKKFFNVIQLLNITLDKSELWLKFFK